MTAYITPAMLRALTYAHETQQQGKPGIIYRGGPQLGEPGQHATAATLSALARRGLVTPITAETTTRRGHRVPTLDAVQITDEGSAWVERLQRLENAANDAEPTEAEEPRSLPHITIKAQDLVPGHLIHLEDAEPHTYAQILTGPVERFEGWATVTATSEDDHGTPSTATHSYPADAPITVATLALINTTPPAVVSDAPTLRTYTVTYLMRLSDHEILVAAVLAGEHNCVDSESNSGQWGDYQRMADTVQAADPDAAEEIIQDAHSEDCCECHDECPECLPEGDSVDMHSDITLEDAETALRTLGEYDQNYGWPDPMLILNHERQAIITKVSLLWTEQEESDEPADLTGLLDTAERAAALDALGAYVYFYDGLKDGHDVLSSRQKKIAAKVGRAWIIQQSATDA
ncbi:hypothetical protein ACFWYW_23840 [Nonomuraea sp. NPDC059023]|uniref:hypothetical protein n=1 Tax=unclassified Nonomuraea TaxID=2593643 RepID=UPI0036C296E4